MAVRDAQRARTAAASAERVGSTGEKHAPAHQRGTPNRATKPRPRRDGQRAAPEQKAIGPRSAASQPIAQKRFAP